MPWPSAPTRNGAVAADAFSIYIKVVNAIPRVVLGSIFITMFDRGMGSKVAPAVKI
jgi:NitT/TauT family transport system permease protein